MSATADITHDVYDLLASIDELLKTDTAREAANIARDLGAVPQFNAALDAFDQGLATLDDGVAGVKRQIVQADSLVAGFEVLAVVLEDFGTGEWLQESSRLLDGSTPREVVRRVCEKIGECGRCLDATLDLAEALPTPDDLRSIHERVQRMRTTVTELKAAPLSAPKKSI
jgi:hypothetical protein